MMAIQPKVVAQPLLLFVVIASEALKHKIHEADEKTYVGLGAPRPMQITNRRGCRNQGHNPKRDNDPAWVMGSGNQG